MTSNELEIFKQSILDDVRVMMQTTGQVTQYIGARYVPLFADPLEWDNNKEYEPLTIVTNQGNSFTSRQFVPKGIDISNTSFWANTGNYNAQIEQYRQEVRAFDSRITAAQNAADSKAPINHATDSTEYGIGNELNYGHVKLSDDISSSDSNNGISATPKLVKDIFDKMSNLVNVLENGFTTNIDAVAFNSWLSTLPTNSTIFFPAGAYNINGAIKFPTTTRMNILGETNAYTEQDGTLQTSLSFTNLKNGEYAITPSPYRIVIKNIKIKCNAYKVIFNKDNFESGIDTSDVTLNNQGIGGIYIPDNSYGVVIDNVTVTQCSTQGIRASIYSSILNCGIFNCATGLTVYNDCNVTNCRIANVNTGIIASNASLSQISNIRIDSVISNAIYCANSNGVIITNINADYIQANAIVLNNCTSCEINNVISRCGVKYAKTSSDYQDAAKNNSVKEAALIRFQNGTKNCSIESPFIVANPLDTISEYLSPLNFAFFDSANISANNIVIKNIPTISSFNGKITQDLFKQLLGKSTLSYPNTSGNIASIPYTVYGNQIASPIFSQVS